MKEIEFASYNLKPEIIKAIQELGFKEFTEIQKLVFEKIDFKSSLICQSETGSGKTHAFLLPLFNKMKLAEKQIQSVIIAPTKELVRQIENFARQINKHFNDEFKILALSGGSDRLKEMEKIKKNFYHLVIASPGKLHDYVLKEGILNISVADYLIIDEADMALDMGFLQEMQLIIDKIKEKKVFLFSATLPEQIKAFIKKIVKNQEFLYLKSDEYQKLLIDHFFIKIKDEKAKDEALIKLLKIINPYLCLIFANTTEEVQRIYRVLKDLGINIISLHSKLDSRERKKIHERIMKLEYTFIVCSDTLARGIDIKGVSHIINYELPKDFAFYLHRTGRTGRAGLSGISYSFYSHNDLDYPRSLKEKNINVFYANIKDDEIAIDKKEVLKKENNSQTINKKTVKKVAPNYKKKMAANRKKQTKGREK